MSDAKYGSYTTVIDHISQFPDDQIDRAVAFLGRCVMSDPLFTRYIKYLAGRKDATVSEPWHAQADRLSAVMATLTAPLLSNDLAPDDRVALAAVILESQVYLWRSDIFDMAYMMPLPRHTISRELTPYNQMFFTFEHGRSVSDAAGGGGSHMGALYWIQLQAGDNGIALLNGVQKHPKLGTCMAISHIPYGAIYPDDFTDLSRASSGLALRLLAFLSSPFIQTTTHAYDRGTLAVLDHAFTGAPDHSADLTSVVVLRREAADALKQYDDDTAAGRIYTHRWWVSGHLRAQWYPSQKAHRLVWIAPYLKGPEDGELIQKTYAVIR